MYHSRCALTVTIQKTYGMKFFTFVDILTECGWAYHNFMRVVDGEKCNGKKRRGYRYVLSACYYDSRSLSFEALKERLLAAERKVGKLCFGAAQHKYAHTIGYPTVIIWD